MSDPNFDPYYKWLGISPDDQPANHYRLLGVDQFESDADVIESAAQRQTSHVRTFALGKYTEASQALLNELSTARVTLLNPDRRKEYDKRLKAEQQSNAPSIDQGSGGGLQQRGLVEVAIEPVPGRKSVSSRRTRVGSRQKKVPLGVIGLVVLVLGIVLAFSLYVSFSGGDKRVAAKNARVLSQNTAKQEATTKKESPPNRKKLPANENTLGNSIASGASTQSSTQEKAAGPAPVASVDPESSESTPIASTGTPEPSGSDAAAVMSGVVGDPPPPAIAPFDSATAQKHQEAWAKHLGVPVEVTNAIGMKLRVIPPGTFAMGEGGRGREVTLTRPFMLGAYEVTQEQYEKVMDINPSLSKGGIKPVENVSWEDAVKFCRKLSELPSEKAAGRIYRLPTEAQWEHACRSGTQTTYSFGDDESKLGDYGWFRDNSNGRTHPCGVKQPNAWGLSDMHGNVWEWCNDWFGSYPSGSVTDPKGPQSGSSHVLRGASFGDYAVDCRSASRARDRSNPHVYGFRVSCVPSIAASTKIAASPSMDSGEDVEPAAASSPPVPEPANNGPAPAVAPFAAEQAKAYQEAWANYLGVPVEFTNSIGMKFSLIPPGVFLMGDSKGTTAGEAGPHNGVTVPVRKVTISEPFFLGVHEVTRTQYASVMDTGLAGPKDGQLPINGMSWEDAVAFCKRLSQRSQGLGKEEQYSLPSEAQWEYACRAGSQSRYFFGEDAAELKDYAVSKASGARGPSQIGTKKPNAWGLHDMHGNLWEWCNDWYGVYQTDSPDGPATGQSRIQRGGCWNDAGVTTGYRNMNPPQLKHNLHGFRVALAIPAKKEIKEVETATNPKKDKYTLRIMQSRFGNRVGASKVAALAEFGGTQASEAAVAEALKWFARHQMPNGGWTFQHDLVCRGQCTDSCDVSYNKSYNAATAMALLPFLGAGQTQYTGEFKQNVKLGLFFLTKNGKQGKKNGLPVLDLRDETGNMYSHGLAAIALCEAYGMTKDRALLPYAQASLNFIFTAQCSDGGWRYSPDGIGGGDTSVLGWQVTALKSGLMAKLAVPPQTIQGSMLFLDKVQSNGGAVYGYTGPVPSFRPATSSIGLLGRMYTGWDKTHPGIVGGLKELREQGFSKNDFYYNYYASQVLIQSGGDAWDEFNVEMRDYLVETQSQEGGAKGSWYVKGGHTSNAGRLCITSFATMMLEVYYRNLPLQ